MTKFESVDAYLEAFPGSVSPASKLVRKSLAAYDVNDKGTIRFGCDELIAKLRAREVSAQ